VDRARVFENRNLFTEWFLWFYGKRSPLPDGQQPVVTPAPPDLSVVINKTAEFVAKFGPGAEDHLRSRFFLMDFVTSAKII
jgi:hypothetical protein